MKQHRPRLLWLTAAFAAVAVVVVGAASCGTGSKNNAVVVADPSIDGLEIIATHPHDPGAYTQGLEFLDDGRLLESTGLRGESTLRIVDPATGEVEAIASLPADHFGEGATLIDDGTVWQLTWQAGVATRWRIDGADPEPIATAMYDTEGWGLCLLGDELVMSDGSASLTFRDPQTFAPFRTVTVSRDGKSVDAINELECVGGTVLANRYQTNEIVAINPSNGEVSETIDASELVPEGFENNNDLVLNGIAYNSETGYFWLTGKQWPVMYEVSLAGPGSG